MNAFVNRYLRLLGCAATHWISDNAAPVVEALSEIQ